MNDAERAAIRRWLERRSPANLPATLKWSLLWAALGSVGWFAGRAWLGPTAGLLLAVLFALLLAACVSGYVDDLIHHRRTDRQFRSGFLAALADGTVQVERVEAAGVVELLQFEDEGSSYFFDVGDNRILFLEGRGLRPQDGSAWPNTSFEIVQTAKDKLWVGLFCHGRQLPPLRRIEPKEFDYDLWPEERLFSGRLETLEEDLRRHRDRRMDNRAADG